MSSWSSLLDQIDALPKEERLTWLHERHTRALVDISKLRGGTSVAFYCSAFLQKPQAPPQAISLASEDLNGFMAAVHALQCDRPLTLLLHTPGGVTNSAQTIVEYLRSKFERIEVVVPTFAMSAGTMISLGADEIVMGRQSQLGPIDPQLVTAQGALSARAIVDQFNQAKAEIQRSKAMALAWAPILQSLGPDLLVRAQYALGYGERMVASWLAQYMLRNKARKAATVLGKRIAKHFNDAAAHMSHGRRIDRDEARDRGVIVTDLESSQELQDAVLVAYHTATIIFERSAITKFVSTQEKKVWVKGWGSDIDPR